MAKKENSQPGASVPPVETGRGFRETNPASLAVKSLVHRQRLLQYYRCRRGQRPLARG